MSKKSKKFDTPATPTDSPAPTLGAELAAATEGADAPAEPKLPRAPRIVRPRFVLIDGDGKEFKFTHYALPTRRAPTGKITIDGVETDFIVTKSTSRDKTEERAYSYFKLPNEHTGYTTVELVAGTVFRVEERAPAAPFGREAKGEPSQGEPSQSEPSQGEPSQGGATLPRAEMPVEEQE